MKWHIVTGSKGGVGKTLLSLLLLVYHLKEESEAGSTLILDLNSMNTDLSAILLFKNAVQRKQITLPLTTNVEFYHLDAKQINYELAQTSQNDTYVVGYLINPFVTMNPQLFADLLSSITLHTEEIETQLNLLLPLRHIIVDTNYHFCNLFGQAKQQDNKNNSYSNYQAEEILGGEEIYIWFLWVYQQLRKILDNTEDGAIIKTTANTIEQYLKGAACQTSGKTTPFVHVFTPTSLLTNSDEKKGWLGGLIDAVKMDKDYTVAQFKQLEEFIPLTESVDFGTWLEWLNQAYGKLKSEKNLQSGELFADAILKAVELFSKGQRPQNIIPVSLFQSTLKNYTDKERQSAVAIDRLSKIDLYTKHLLKLFKQL